MNRRSKCSLVFSAALACILSGAVDAAEQVRHLAASTDGSVFSRVRWSPYTVGAGIGLLSMLTFLVSNEAIGVSGAFARTSGMIERLFRGKRVEQKDYYRKFRPAINWEWMFVVGLIVGSFASAWWSGDFELVWVPDRWIADAGGSRVLRWLVAFLGGVIMGFGARWAGGCTSGHGISGTLQLAVSSWIVTVALFVSGIATAMLIFHGILE